MQENCDLDIDFILRDCFIHKREKATVYLNFDNDKNINVELEQDKLKNMLIIICQYIQVGFYPHLENIN